MRTDASAEDRRDKHFGRRTLVRAGATAAWTVPVIAMAAPALAATCSGGSTSLSAVLVGPVDQSGHNPTTVTFKVQVCDTGGSATCALSATAVAPGAIGKLSALTVGTWAGATSSDGAKALTVQAPANGELAAGACAIYNVTVKVKGGAGQLTLIFKTANGGLATVSLSVGDS